MTQKICLDHLIAATPVEGPSGTNEGSDEEPALADRLIQYLATNYVRRENRFFDINRPRESMTRDDLERAFLVVAQKVNNGKPVDTATMREVYSVAIRQKNADWNRSIQPWTGTVESHPSNPSLRIQLHNGVVVLNAWREPVYRRLDPTLYDLRIFAEFFRTVFQVEAERRRVLNWLAWCLQNEDKKPNWAVMLHSRSKGTGKSTFCQIAAHLFGRENTLIENNIEKVAGKFNAPILHSKLIICEEVHPRPDSDVGNKLKTLITEPFTAAERKGRDVEQMRLHSCFMLTTNHSPYWVEAGERRFYIVDTDHDGHASGSKAAEFSALVQKVTQALAEPQCVAALYRSFMKRELAEDFDPMSLNVDLHATEIMKKLQAYQIPATTQQLAEYLGREKCIAITEQDLAAYVTSGMRVNPNALRHMMDELRWTRHSVKWGGKDYARAIWVAPDHGVYRGEILGPQGFKQAVCDVLWDAN